MQTRNRRLTDEQFFRERKEVLALWPTGRDVDLDEALEFHRSLPPGKNYALKSVEAKKKGLTYFCSMMGTAPLERDIEFARYLQDEGQSDVLSTVIDSMTRNKLFESADRQLTEMERTGRQLLNGLPVVHYGVAGVRKKIQAVDAPVMIWGPTPDSRLVDEIALAAGHTGVGHAGPMCTFFHYAKNLPLETCVSYFQYVYRLGAYYQERGIPIQHRALGSIPCITPPSLIFAPEIIEMLIAAEQGVKHIELVYWGIHGNLTQAVASVIALRKLGQEYLDRFGYGDVVLTMLVGYAANTPWPRDYAQAFAVVSMAPLVARLSGAELCYVTTIDEAHKIPSKEHNAASLRCARMMLNLLHGQRIDLASSPAVTIEADMVEKETKAILDRVIDFGDGDVVVGAARAVEVGVLDQPFATNQRVARKAFGVRDADGAVRYLSHGSLPFGKDILDFHREKVAEREKALGRKVDYDTAVSDIVAISRGSLLLPPDWQQRELANIGADLKLDFSE